MATSTAVERKKANHISQVIPVNAVEAEQILPNRMLFDHLENKTTAHRLKESGQSLLAADLDVVTSQLRSVRQQLERDGTKTTMSKRKILADFARKELVNLLGRIEKTAQQEHSKISQSVDKIQLFLQPANTLEFMKICRMVDSFTPEDRQSLMVRAKSDKDLCKSLLADPAAMKRLNLTDRNWDQLANYATRHALGPDGYESYRKAEAAFSNIKALEKAVFTAAENMGNLSANSGFFDPSNLS